MRWQRAAQAAIAIFVIGFVVVLAMTLRKESAAPVQPPPVPTTDVTGFNTANLGGCNQVSAAEGKRVFSLKCGEHFAFPDGRQKLTKGVELSLPRNDREFLLKADEAEVKPTEGGIEKADFKGNVRITTEGGLVVTSAEASYVDADGIVTIPGPVEFAKGRMKGSGVGAIYDRTRETLWIQAQARINVAADPATGEKPMEGTANRIGMARADHFIRLEGNGRLLSDGRTVEADDIVIRLTPDDERVTGMELRGNSRIGGGSGGPQAMSARDIDLTYAEDGRTLQRAVLTENAAVRLAGAAGPAGKRIAGTTIDMTLGPDGSTVTNLSANGKVVVDLPPEKTSPAKQIRSATLVAAGEPTAGLQAATFGGGVDYRETRPAQGKTAAQSRTARSDSLVLATAPGLGAIQQADFRGNVTFGDGPDFKAEAPQAIYQIERDRLDLAPGEYPGKAPLVSDARISIAARTISIALATRDLVAETRVRSTMLPAKKDAKPSDDDRRLPAMLSKDKPVFVTSNRLQYSGNAAAATYDGSAVLWQDDTQIKGDKIVIDDRKGNLSSAGTVTTRFFVEEADRKTGVRKRVETRGSSDAFTYEEARRLATYTGKARIIGAQGDVAGDKIELFMKAAENELERAEAYGTVSVREGDRLATGSHLTYTAATDEYLMIGAPVEIIEARKDGCVRTVGATARFNRTSEAARVDGSRLIPMEQKTIPCPAGVGR